MIVGVVCLLVVSSASASPVNTNPQTRKPCGHSVTTHRHGLADTERVLARSRDKGQLRHFRSCARTEGKRRQMVRLEEQARQEQQAVTPYFFGEPTIPRVAIPPYIVRCETNGYFGASRWQAHNPSGAHSLYQMMPSTYGAYCDSCDWSRADQHLAARRLYVSQGSSPWTCA